MYKLTCKYCNNIFEHQRNTIKYCCLRCAYDDRIGKPRHPNSGKKRTKKPTQFICKYCGKTFEKFVYPNLLKKCTFEFCSTSCSNKARIIKDIPCPICGKSFKPRINDTNKHRKKFCSAECAGIARRGKPGNNKTPDKIIKVIKRFYPTYGCAYVAKKLNLTKSMVSNLAYRNGIKLNKDTYYKLVHGAAQKYMTSNNPMKQDKIKAKVSAWQKAHPDIISSKNAKGRSQNQRDKPSGLEKKLHNILDELKIDYEPAAIVKPKFVVDIRIGNIIIQADGDYWHGHPRFEPLTDRQKSQQKRDIAQDKYLTTCGYTVIRIWESDMCKEKVIDVLSEHNILRPN